MIRSIGIAHPDCQAASNAWSPIVLRSDDRFRQTRQREFILRVASWTLLLGARQLRSPGPVRLPPARPLKQLAIRASPTER